MPRFPGVSQCTSLPGGLTQHRTGSVPSQTEVQTRLHKVLSLLPSVRLSQGSYCDTQWPSSWEVTWGLMQFHHFLSSPDLQQVITRRQINNRKWTVQKAAWWVLWHFKHLFDSKGWKRGWMKNNRAHCPKRRLSLTAPFKCQRKHFILVKEEGKRISGVVSSLEITQDLNRNCNYLYTNSSWRKL